MKDGTIPQIEHRPVHSKARPNQSHTPPSHPTPPQKKREKEEKGAHNFVGKRPVVFWTWDFFIKHHKPGNNLYWSQINDTSNKVCVHLTFIVENTFHEIKVTKFCNFKQYFKHRWSNSCLFLPEKKREKAQNNVNHFASCFNTQYVFERDTWSSSGLLSSSITPSNLHVTFK